MQELLLVVAVIGVGILHTMVPDHWAPIALLARQRGWSRTGTARAAFQAGAGHVGTTLLFGIGVWLVGAAAAQTMGRLVDILASAALVAFGLWIAVGAWRLTRAESHKGNNTPDHGHGRAEGHTHDHTHDWGTDPLYSPTRGAQIAERHSHVHHHGSGAEQTHWHDHSAAAAHAITADMTLLPPVHSHQHRTTGRMALLLMLGSSPMVEGIRAFFAAARYGAGLIMAMRAALAASTIATYVVLSVYSATGLQRLNLGPIERCGEVISGAFIALIGVAFGLWSTLL
jgi:hypothetical protein